VIKEKAIVFSLHHYFLRLFFWLAAIFSLEVIGAGFAGATFPSVPGADFVSGLSTFRLFPFEVPLSLMGNNAVRQDK